MAGVHNMLAGAGGAFVFQPPPISVDTSNYNLRNAAVAAGWNGLTPLAAIIKVNSGIVVSANNAGVYGFDTGTTAYPPGSSLELDTQGAYILGMGGASNSGAGGPAARINLPTKWNNLGGVLGGGGGAGGVGQTLTITVDYGKGASANYTGVGGNGGGGRTGRTNSSLNGTFAGGGAGYGGSYANEGAQYAQGGTGGAGGNWGAPGAGGGGGAYAGSLAGASGPGGGGAGGVAIVGDSFVNWINQGSRLGTISP